MGGGSGASSPGWKSGRTLFPKAAHFRIGRRTDGVFNSLAGKLAGSSVEKLEPGACKIRVLDARNLGSLAKRASAKLLGWNAAERVAGGEVSSPAEEPVSGFG